MDKSQNLPLIDEETLDGVAGGSPLAVNITKINMAIGGAAITPLKIAGIIVGGQLGIIGDSITAIGDAMAQVGAAISGK